jgi:hypothetical protein
MYVLYMSCMAAPCVCVYVCVCVCVCVCVRVRTDNMHEYSRQLQRFNVGEDCPVFDGLFEFCQMYTSGSIGE